MKNLKSPSHTCDCDNATQMRCYLWPRKFNDANSVDFDWNRSFQININHLPAELSAYWDAFGNPLIPCVRVKSNWCTVLACCFITQMHRTCAIFVLNEILCIWNVMKTVYRIEEKQTISWQAIVWIPNMSHYIEIECQFEGIIKWLHYNIIYQS